MYNDNKYFDAFMNRDSKVIDHFYKKEYQKVVLFIQKHGGTLEEAQDIVQEGIIILYNNIRLKKYEVRQGASMSTYFIQICKFKWYDKLKSAHHKRTTSITKEMESLIKENDSLERIKAQEMEQNKVHQAMEKLDAKCKELLRLYYWEKLSLTDIAPKVGLTKESVKNAKYRCMKKLRTHFKV